ncbi:MAG: ASCH domain-containing protein [Anaerolineae bacterium]
MLVDQVKVLWIKDEYLQQVLAGNKTIEVRVGYSNIRKLHVGQVVRLNDRYLFRLARVIIYPDFASLLAHEDPAQIAPGLAPEALLAAIRSIYPPEKEALGAVALQLEPILSAQA